MLIPSRLPDINVFVFPGLLSVPCFESVEMSRNDDLEIDMKIKEAISPELAWAYRIIPSRRTDAGYEFYIDAGSSVPNASDELAILLGSQISLIPTETQKIDKALALHFVKDKKAGSTFVTSTALDIASKNFVSMLLQEARSLKSSDIHIETYEQRCRIRLRIDGKLVERLQVDKSDYPALVNKIKIMASLDISEKRLPQDGRIFFNQGDLKFDVRVSVLPTLYAEKIVLRILANSATDVNLDNLGFSETDISRYKEAIRKPSGIILISGPTGSGKTTTLYGTLRVLNKTTDNILTVEDPIEYTLEGVNQVQVKEDIGLTFSSALRSFLRQDPDIIMVGEIRDSETANLAIRAALTGHLVLSTIHTNSAWGTISRLLDMGIPAFLLANTMNVSVAQRLVRLLCEHCKKAVEFKPIVLPGNFRPAHAPDQHFIAKGCDDCFYSGYRGRKAIYEVIPVDQIVASLILKGSSQETEYFHKQGIQTLQASAFELVCKGQTSIEEIYPLLLNDQY
jgi:type IV pilus assembly protein PilB